MTKQVKILLAVLLVVVCACCAALLLPKQGGTIARITRDGVLVEEINLDKQSQPYHITVGDGEATNVIRAEQGRICMIEANCPDQVCVNQGWISDSALPIVCLPNKVIVEIVGGEGELDVLVK